MSAAELQWLSGHLGHDVATHKKSYRLHPTAVEITKVGKLLLALEGIQFVQVVDNCILCCYMLYSITFIQLSVWFCSVVLRSDGVQQLLMSFAFAKCALFFQLRLFNIC